MDEANQASAPLVSETARAQTEQELGDQR